MDTPTTKKTQAYAILLDDHVQTGGHVPPFYVARNNLLALDRITEQLKRIADVLERG